MSHRRWLVPIGLIVLMPAVASSSGAHQPEHQWLIVPGERVGAITAESTEASLEAHFGAHNVQRIDVQLGEGFTVPGNVIYPSDATRRVEVVWRDGARVAPKEVRLTGNESTWRTVEGITLGSTLRDIELLNGVPFRMMGFAWDYHGTIVDCGRGRLTILGCSGDAKAGRAPQARQIVLRLSPVGNALEVPEYRQVVGERVFSSGHPAMQTLNPRVYQMIVFIGSSADKR